MKKQDFDLVSLTKKRIDAWDRFAECMHKDMKDFYDMYTGQFFVRKDDIARDFYYETRLIYTTVNNFVPSIIMSDPDIFLKPQKDTSTQIAETVEIVSNYYWRELGIKEEVKKSLYDAYIYGFGIVKVGWNTKLSPMGKKFEDDSPGGEKTFDVSEYVKKDAPFVNRISPFLFMWDPQARSLETARWVGEKIIKPIEAVINNNSYDKKALELIQPNTYGVQDVIFGSDGGAALVDDDPDKYVCLYEVHDREREILITLAEGVEVPLRIIPYPYKKLEGTHYTMLVLNPLPDKVEGTSIPELLRDQQIALNRARTLQMNHAKRCARIYGVDVNGAITDKDLEAISKAVDGTIVKINGSPDQIKPLDHAPLPQELFIIGDIAKGEALQITGQPPSDFGMPAGGRTSATEIQSMNTAKQFRVEDHRTIVENFAARITKKLIQIISDKLSDKKVVMITGEDKFIPFKFSKEDIQGEFDFSISAGSMNKASREVERQQLIQLLNIASQIPNINVLEIVKKIMQTFGWKDINRFFMQTPPAVPQTPATNIQPENPNPPSQADILAPMTNQTTNEA